MKDAATLQAAGFGPDLGPFDWADPFRLEDQLTEEERMLRDAARDFAQAELAPIARDAFAAETEAPELFAKMGAAGLLGVTIPEEFGGLGSSYVTYGLVAREIERVDSGYRSMMSVQSSLVMYPILAYGSDAQKARLLPGLASGDLIGCFGLTEPDAGSDPGGMKTRAARTDGGYRLTGSKMWISNAPFADVFVVWAKSEAHDGKIRGFVLEKGMPGLSAPRIKGKQSCGPPPRGRSSWTASRWARGAPARRAGAEGSVRLPKPRALRHRLGRDGRGRVLLARGAVLWA